MPAMNRKFQRSVAALVDVVHGAVAGHLAVAAGLRLLRHAEALVELGDQIAQLEVRGRFVGIVVAEQRQRDADHRHPLAARARR